MSVLCEIAEQAISIDCWFNDKPDSLDCQVEIAINGVNLPEFLYPARDGAGGGEGRVGTKALGCCGEGLSRRPGFP
jgi:hypothetical protein